MYETRNIKKFVPPGDIFNSYGKQGKNFLVPKLFNKLPDELKNMKRISEVKKYLKDYLSEMNIK